MFERGMSKLKTSKLWVSVLACALMLSACSTANNEGTSATSPTATPSENEEAIDPLGKYDPPIEISTVVGTNPSLIFNPGEDIDNNSVYKSYEEDLGIKLKNKWAVDSSQYESKMKITIASNDLPDFMMVTRADLDQLIESEMILDLSELYEKYATPETKKFLTADGGAQLDSGKSNGKLMAIPKTDAPYVNAQMLFVRKDWLKNLDLPEPKTMDDVFRIAEAFTTMDPDGNNKNDTIGISVQKNFNTGGDQSLLGIFNGYHAYPGTWIKKTSGDVEYGGIQPEVKTALLQLQNMFKAGQLDKEFIVKDSAKAAERIVSNQVGMTLGPFWMGSYPLMSGAVKDGAVIQDWGVYPLPSIDDQPALNPIELGVTGYYVVSKKAKNPEAVIKLLNRWVLAQTRNDKEEDTKRYTEGTLTDQHQAYYTLNPIFVNGMDTQIRAGELLPPAISSKDPSKLLNSQMDGYNDALAFATGDVTKYGAHMAFTDGGTQQMLYKYFQEDGYLLNAYTGAQTPTMAGRWSTLATKEFEVFSKIITNGASIDEFDKFVEQWHSLGGTDITKEINEKLNSK
jgi:putative aldouronate transport system substrate-binding protein